MRVRTGAAATGGLYWHLRALRFRGSLWASFRAGLEAWLDGWRPPADRLLLIGPSAGWCAPSGFFTRFRRIDAIDLDPLAEPLFRLNHGRALRRAGVALEWAREDFFADPRRILDRHGDCAVLFCNVAGQIGFGLRDPGLAQARLLQAREALRGRPWASFHELLSGKSLQAPSPLVLPGRVEDRELLSSLGMAGEWLDHLTGEFLPAQAPRLVLPWRFEPGRLHLVEAGVAQA